ncbi:MAG: hypothetical protein WA830_01795 [Candidatus Sulfotelmatobacter sp.]
MSRRPLGITIGAILFAANAAYCVGFAALAILNHNALRSVLRALSPSGMGPEAAHLAMGRLLPLYYVLMAGLTVALAIGFWKLWNWSRIVVLVLLGLSLLSLIAEVRPLIAQPTTSAVGLTVLRLGLIALVGWYFLRAPIRDAFLKQRVRATGA